MDIDVGASNTYDQSEDIVVKTDTVPASTWDLHDAKCILSMKSDCCIDVKGFRFFTMERLFYALQLLTLGDKKYIRQLAKYTLMDYVRKCVNTRFELASTTLQDKWLDEQFQTWTQIITARILSDILYRHYWIQPAHLCVNPMTQCMRQRLRQQEKCVLNKNNSVGLHGSAAPHV